MKNPALLKIMQQFILDKLSGELEKLPSKRLPAKSNSGFTMIELLVVIIIIGVLSAIAAPGWLAFLNRQRVNAVNDAALNALREAQREAKRTKRDYSVSFKIEAQVPQVLVHRADVAAASIPANEWKKLGENQDIKPGQILLYSNITTPNKAPVGGVISYAPTTAKTITFNYQGTLPQDADTGLTIAVATANSNYTAPTGPKRCVKVTTLLGAIQAEKDDKCPS
ncbi:prepilin-type N-terminal cleavage/methylation domain-containing protein [Funiculus sociatus GB2-A5]|uniref:Prepilin-type N-terminal cleavage/methylation domain-containing protein n=1 Tax=Funiculus sociatus GB2-A5 TaxID=2933946 RepID=A0ABV0JIT4_9CYAN|nr:prepilin-type N-terminal cleavage/methylation domain-containing protein [Trichocoleus sp. FACHB-6]